MNRVIENFLVLVLATSLYTVCQELPVNHLSSASLVAGARAGVCPATQNQRESVEQLVHSFIKNSVLPSLGIRGACGCGGPGWRRAAYLNMSDPTQTCPPQWELITIPKRSCARPSNAGQYSCYSAIFPTQGIEYSQVCGRIIGYQKGQPEAFVSNVNDIELQYVDGVSLTYGSPRQHIWTFASAIDEYPHLYIGKCPCSNITEQRSISVPSFIGSDYFCETGVPPGQQFNNSIFYADDPLWDGGGCGPTSACCTFNNPPWFCKQLPQSTSADLEVRLCSNYLSSYENTPIELIEIYIK